MRASSLLGGELSSASVPCEPKLEVTAQAKRQGTSKDPARTRRSLLDIGGEGDTLKGS
jgi:hypothetical protein